MTLPRRQAMTADAPVYVLYHAGCDDGHGAAWAAWTALGDRATYLPVQYGEPLPKLPEGAIVAVVDFSYPREVLLELRARCAALDVLDHHATAAKDLADLPFALFDMDKSGARLAWEFWHPHTEMPALLAHVEDRDLWRFALPGTKEVSAWLRSWPREFPRWDVLAAELDRHPDLARAQGAAILRMNAQHVAAHVRAAVLVRFDGQTVPCVNATMLQSEIGAELCARHPEAPFSLTYFDRDDGQRVWSLRARRVDIDCGAIAKAYGGGGHPGAAGFTVLNTGGNCLYIRRGIRHYLKHKRVGPGIYDVWLEPAR